MSKLNDLLARKAPQQSQQSQQPIVRQPSIGAQLIAHASPLDAIDTVISLTTDVTEWPTIAHENFNTETLEGQLKALFNNLQAKLVTADVSDAMKRVMLFISDNPALEDTLLPDDMGLLTSALEASYGVMITQKVANKTKRTKSAENVASISDLFNDIKF